MQSSKKILWADNVRFFATLGVIVLHASGSGLYKFGVIPGTHWGILNVTDSAMRCCVPLFVMLSGALVLRQDKELLPYLKNRFWRVLLPFLFWAFVYCIVYTLSIWKNLKLIEIPAVLGEIMTDIIYFKGIFKQQAFHLWYVYMILGLFMIVPILRKWIKNAKEKEIIYFLILWIISVILNITSINPFKPNIDLTFFSGYLGYFVLGYYLSIKKFEEIPVLKKMLGFIIILLVAITAYLTFYLTEKQGILDQEFYIYLSPNIILLSATVFIWLKTFRIKQTGISSCISFVNQYSFGIYLVHIIILRILKRLGLEWSFIHPLIGIPLTAIICFTISFGVIYCVRKIPGGKYISG